ncbi:MAG TPA: hypothetical protein VL358_02180 [Caulobacteraceae bacterium]|jgi:hypothetical protein|nr:hypothetical protein [Caulobacteraceae bacterium]
MFHVAPSSAAADAVPADAPPADAGAAARALTQRQLAMLTRLAEIGMDIAEACGRQARASLDGETPAEAAGPEGLFRTDPGLAFARVARAVRLTIALQSRLSKDAAALDRARAEARRARIHRLVERAIEAEHEDADAIDRLSDDAWERLNEEEDWDGLDARPLAQTVARICRDLGLAPDVWVGEMGVGPMGLGETGTGGMEVGEAGTGPPEVGARGTAAGRHRPDRPWPPNPSAAVPDPAPRVFPP